MAEAQLLAGLSFLLLASLVAAKTQQVTCGSVVKLMNQNHKIRLHSHDVKYGSGSGQQSVTGSTQNEDVNSHWLLKGPEFDDLCKRGEPVACGQKLRLEHLTTNRLSSCHLLSPSPFPGTCTATTSHPHSPTSRRFLLLERWEKGTQEMYGRWCATPTTGSATR